MPQAANPRPDRAAHLQRKGPACRCNCRLSLRLRQNPARIRFPPPHALRNFRPTMIAFLIAVENTADKRPRFIDRAESRVPVKESTCILVAFVVEEISNDGLRFPAKAIIVDWCTIPDERLAFRVAQRRLDQCQFAAQATTTCIADRRRSLDAQFTLVSPVLRIFVELVFVDSHRDRWSTIQCQPSARNRFSPAVMPGQAQFVTIYSPH